MPYSKPTALQQPSIQRWLRHRLKLLENSKVENPGRQFDRINAKIFPDLFNPTDASADRLLWADILELESLDIVSIQRKRKHRDPYASEWQSTSIAFQPTAEQTVRQWLDCPIISPEQEKWNQALDKVSNKFADVSLLIQNPFPSINKSATEILDRLLLIPDKLASKPMTTYQISAELFWGNSKLLKDKEAWLQRLLDLPATQILPRPLLLDISFPHCEAKGLLLIENKDSYIAAVDGNWPLASDLILIYMQGNKATASNMRDPARVRFHLHNPYSVPDSALQKFKIYWYQESDSHIGHTFAITDLDWSGLAMFRRLKRLFPKLEPWQPGYNAMLTEIKKGNYHNAAAAGKKGQEPITSSGSEWLDQNILPVLEKDQFVDQEAIQFDSGV